MDTPSAIEWCKSKIDALPDALSWKQSVLTQLDYCAAVTSGLDDPAQLERLNIGLIAAREMDGWPNDDELPRRLMEVQYDLQDKYLSYAAKVRLGIHRRT